MDKLLYITILSLSVIGCSISYEDVDVNKRCHAQVNGFDLSYPKYVSVNQKRVIEDILNNMVYVEGGIFKMGCEYTTIVDSSNNNNPEYYPLINEQPVKYVSLDDFYVSKYELTIEQVEQLLKCDLPEELDWSYEDWEDIINVLREYTNIRFDFPTEAQWEFVAKGGLKSNKYLYPGTNCLQNARTKSKEIYTTKSPNELGIYNLADHYSEWCKDCYSEYKVSAMLSNPFIQFGIGHVVRGGNYASSRYYGKYNNNFDNFSFSTWYKEYRISRSTSRLYHDGSSIYIGCRLVIN